MSKEQLFEGTETDHCSIFVVSNNLILFQGGTTSAGRALVSKASATAWATQGMVAQLVVIAAFWLVS